MSLSPLLFKQLSTESNNETKLLLFDNDGNDSCIKTPDVNNNRAFGLVNNADDGYPDDMAECQTRKCRTLTIYKNNNNNNNNSYYNSENSVDKNFKGNNLYLCSQVDYYSAPTPTGRKLDIATERKTNNDVDSNGIHYCDGIIQKTESNNNKNSENNHDNNSYSNNNNPCADSEDNNDNNTDNNFISASNPPRSNSNADNVPPVRNNKNNVKYLPRFICHPNGMVLQVLMQKTINNRQAIYFIGNKEVIRYRFFEGLCRQTTFRETMSTKLYESSEWNCTMCTKTKKLCRFRQEEREP